MFPSVQATNAIALTLAIFMPCVVYVLPNRCFQHEVSLHRQSNLYGGSDGGGSCPRQTNDHDCDGESFCRDNSCDGESTQIEVNGVMVYVKDCGTAIPSERVYKAAGTDTYSKCKLDATSNPDYDDCIVNSLPCMTATSCSQYCFEVQSEWKCSTTGSASDDDYHNVGFADGERCP